MLFIIQPIVRQYDFNLLYARALVADLSEEQMTQVPGPGLVSHPAFTLGHLVTGSALLAEDLEVPFEIPDGWDELFLRKGPDDQTRPEADTGQYPGKKSLLDELVRQQLWPCHLPCGRYKFACNLCGSPILRTFGLIIPAGQISGKIFFHFISIPYLCTPILILLLL